MNIARTKLTKWRSEPLLLSIVFCTALWQLAVREAYHRGASEVFGMTVLVAAWAASMTLWALLRRARSAAGSRLAPRCLIVLAVALCLYQLGVLPGLQGWGEHPSAVRVLVAWGTLFLVLVFACRLSDATWASVHLSLLVAAFIWTATPMIMGAWLSPRLSWPPEAVAADASQDRGRTVTIVLLLDEMNGKDGGEIAEELRTAGLKVSRVSVPSVGPNTRNVLATLFHGSTFVDAQPCGFTTLCTTSLALDFSHIEAARPDIDIVGIAHPYCAIRGLRHCSRQEEELTLAGMDRLRCRIWRRTGLDVGVTERSCRKLYVGNLASANAANVQKVLEAPALQLGGVLFAHVLLPHPPGTTPTGTLQSHYRDNLVQARALVRELVARARASNLQTRFIVFSDHPLRQQLWCSSFAPYIWDQCKPAPELEDDKVPIIVASPGGYDVSDWTSNRDVFKLIARIQPKP
jgi:hypothetical protein